MKRNDGGYLKIIFLAGLTALMLCVTAFAGTAAVKNGGDKEYKAVRLTPDIYRGAKGDLSDILITDESNNAVAYFINSAEDVYSLSSKNYGLALYDRFEKNGDMSFDFYADITGLDMDIAATSISFSTKDSTFAVLADISGSYDGMKWSYIKSDKLYNVDGNRKHTIYFDKAEKYTMYRLTVRDNSNLRFDSAELKYDEAFISRNFYKEELKPRFTVEEEDKETVIRILDVKNLKINEITIETDSLFKRDVYCAGVSKTLYNLAFENAGYSAGDLTIEMMGAPSPGEVLLRIINGDDKPIEIKGITVSYNADELVFKAANTEEYTISFGAKGLDEAPKYDIESYKELILQDGYDLLSIGNVYHETEDEEKADGVDYGFIFNIVVTLVSLLLILVIALRLKPISRTHK